MEIFMYMLTTIIMITAMRGMFTPTKKSVKKRKSKREWSEMNEFKFKQTAPNRLTRVNSRWRDSRGRFSRN